MSESLIAARKADEDARKSIDDDIVIHSAAIMKLKDRRNALAAINRIPPELLSEIFRICRAVPDWRSAGDRYSHQRGFCGWITITWVCRHWREVALGTHRLWSQLDLDVPSFVEECLLPRSHESPWHLTALHWGTRQDGLFRSLFLNFDTIRHIDFTFGRLDQPFGLVPIPSRSSNLESLQIGTDGIGTHKCSLSLFKQCNFPRIQSLQLTNWLDIPPSLFGSTLTTLALRASIYETDMAPSSIDFSEFLKSLSKLMLLEHLSIENIAFSGISRRTATTITLPKLKFLLFHSPSPEYINYVDVLKRLKLPPRVHCYLICSYHSELQEIPKILTDIRVYFSPMRFKSLGVLVENGWFAIQGWLDDPGPLFDESRPKPSLHLGFPPYVSKLRYVWEEFLETIHIRDLKSLLLGSPTDMDMFGDPETTCIRFLTKCHNLETLTIYGNSAEIAISALNDLAEWSPEDGPDVVPIMPKLTTLVLSNVIWRTREECDALEQGPCMFDGQFVRALQIGLSGRGIIGYPVNTVLIQECVAMDDQDVALLEEDVLNVEWDEHFEYHPSYYETESDSDSYASNP
ncbi:hypothetical protein QCA50_011684 [Cerrena zonata]|uniref:F-box domain-containing protein n=1 Tax=Cerrena zonata TaxID=2478898 RepID=A0AAW0G6M0_9APHY